MARRASAERVRSFAPLAGSAPHTLILGSLPGRASLAAGEYYAHPRNLFWDFMGELFGAGRSLPYARRTAVLLEQGLALWDVVHDAHRPGSLDAAIDFVTARHNAIAELVMARPSLQVIAFNGATAARLFTRHVAPTLGPRLAALSLRALPSTSPAHAGLSREAKLTAWRTLLDRPPSTA
jgi:hypoxanthine-DNA glycosylase